MRKYSERILTVALALTSVIIAYSAHSVSGPSVVCIA